MSAFVVPKPWSEVSFAAISRDAEAVISNPSASSVSFNSGAKLNSTGAGPKFTSSFEASGTSKISNIANIVSETCNPYDRTVGLIRVNGSGGAISDGAASSGASSLYSTASSFNATTF